MSFQQAQDCSPAPQKHTRHDFEPCADVTSRRFALIAIFHSMPSPAAEMEAAAPEKSEQEGIYLKRVADFLPQRKVGMTGNPKAPDGIAASWLAMLSGRFLVLNDQIVTEDKGVSTAARDNLVNECTNMGLISALMGTIVIPMAFENVDDWLQEDFAGSGFAFQESWIGQQLSESTLQEVAQGLHDMSLICYFGGAVGYLCSTIATVVLLLCIGEIESDAGSVEFLRRVGGATRVPYLFWWNGGLFVFPVVVRYLCVVKTLGGLIVLILSIVVPASLILLALNHYVRCCMTTHNCINEFEDLHLSPSEAEEDVNTWFQHSQGGGLQDCLQDMALRHGKLVVCLDRISQQHVAMYYHKKQAENVGIPLSPAELYRLSYVSE
ncbi:hypothetical protein AK812_SmicGene35236 [Symbiodinium microadriaticum]|uniref:Uncharacterized protein n=1 Tax=Symbiodinium microadriaticum TaxID=2951 RepID=A0A1Q9CM08_SYMMI|nr:hypothetical protein AK812_SmicGene35236 [Symbiodinium microadriaticum]CAE6970657.1 unnamed protein product [Symbiodinium sp. KB8]CAE7217719.1 unnamed protein product [Symbiodinium microadriaticum]